MIDKPKLSLGSELSPETQTRLEQLTIKTSSKTSNVLSDAVNALQQIAKPEDQKLEEQKSVSQVSMEQEPLPANNLKADDLQTIEPINSNKIVQPKLITEELDLKKREQLLIAKKIKQYQAQIQALSALYPKCFTSNPKPLAIGLDKEIMANEELKPEDERINKTSIKRFLGAYTSKYKYLQSCILGAARIDLEGNEVGVLNQEAVDFAKEKLANCKAWQNQCNSWKQAMNKVKNQNNAWEKAINKVKLKTKETK